MNVRLDELSEAATPQLVEQLELEQGIHTDAVKELRACKKETAAQPSKPAGPKVPKPPAVAPPQQLLKASPNKGRGKGKELPAKPAAKKSGKSEGGKGEKGKAAITPMLPIRAKSTTAAPAPVPGAPRVSPPPPPPPPGSQASSSASAPKPAPTPQASSSTGDKRKLSTPQPGDDVDWSHPRYQKLRPSGRYGHRGGKSKKFFGEKFGEGGWGWDLGESPLEHQKKQHKRDGDDQDDNNIAT